MPALYNALTEIGVEKLYLPDGSVNFEVIRSCLDSLVDSAKDEGRIPDGPSALEQMAAPIWNIAIDWDKKPKSTDEGDMDTKNTDPIDRAIMYYLGDLISRSIEVDIPFADTNPELKENPLFQPTLHEEFERYYSYLEDRQSVRYGKLEQLHEQLGEPQAEADDLKCIVAIPVAGHQEHGNIFRTLEQFRKQDMDAGEFEVWLYLNMPAEEGNHDEQLASETQKTLDEIDRFRRQYPTVPIRTVNAAYYDEKPTIGTIRCDLWDLIGYDLRQRGRQDDILVISADADIVNLNKEYLSGIYDTWQATGADFVTAHLLWQSIPTLPYDSTVNRLLRYQTFVDGLRDNHADTLHAADANTGISLAMYFAVGGYDRNAKLGEMYNLIHEIRKYRNQKEDPNVYAPVKIVEAKSKTSYLKTHSRRLVKAMSLGFAPYQAWDQRIIEFGNNDSLRTEEMEGELAEHFAELNWKKWLKRDTPSYMREVPLAKKRRVLKAARNILGFSDLYNR